MARGPSHDTLNIGRKDHIGCQWKDENLFYHVGRGILGAHVKFVYVAMVI